MFLFVPYAGSNVQYIHWTRDVDYFLGILSCLVFKGDSLNQNTMVEGLASALTVYMLTHTSFTLYSIINLTILLMGFASNFTIK